MPVQLTNCLFLREETLEGKWKSRFQLVCQCDFFTSSTSDSFFLTDCWNSKANFELKCCNGNKTFQFWLVTHGEWTNQVEILCLFSRSLITTSCFPWGLDIPFIPLYSPNPSPLPQTPSSSFSSSPLTLLHQLLCLTFMTPRLYLAEKNHWIESKS